jgi:hypothetical protein
MGCRILNHSNIAGVADWIITSKLDIVLLTFLVNSVVLVSFVI